MHRHKMVDHTTDSYIQAHRQCFHLELKLLDSYFSSTERFSVNSQISKKLTSQVSSWFSATKGIGYEKITRDKANLTSRRHSSYFRTFDGRRKIGYTVCRR